MTDKEDLIEKLKCIALVANDMQALINQNGTDIIGRDEVMYIDSADWRLHNAEAILKNKVGDKKRN